MTATDRQALAAEAYLYGFPLVFDLDEVARFTRSGLGGVPPAPFNTFAHGARLADPTDTFVSINNDTVYSIAQVDVGGGPVRLEVPATSGRYYVLQFVDAWTNNFAYVGRRATGTDAQSYLLVPPGWEGEAPDGARLIRFPTAVASIVGRWAVDGDDDLPAVGALQAGLTLTPVGERAGAGLPEPDPAVPEALRWWESLRVRMRAFPPAPRDLVTQERFAPLGLLTEGASPYADNADPALAADLAAGLEQGRATMERVLRDGASPEVNGWKQTYHAFDYNLDFFGVGTIDAPQWRIEDPRRRTVERAVAARGGLWGNHGYEAAYAMTYVDGDGEQLDGARRYELRLPHDPPVGAFWSVTMYDLPDFYLVANPIDRYSIGDRTRGLHRGPDGSLTIAIQHEPPSDPARRTNWLPTPPGAFRPLLRLYEPGAEVFDGSWEIPPIVRVG